MTGGGSAGAELPPFWNSGQFIPNILKIDGKVGGVMVNRTELEQMRQTDIQSVDIDTLVDIRDVEIDINLNKEEKIEMYLQQVKNPYCMRYKDVKIQMEFSDDGQSLDEKMEQYLAKKNLENSGLLGF